MRELTANSNSNLKSHSDELGLWLIIRMSEINEEKSETNMFHSHPAQPCI